MTLTKKEIIEAVAEETGFPKNQSVELVETLIEIIKKTLVSGDDVLVSGFGKFNVRDKESTEGTESGYWSGFDIGTEEGRDVSLFREVEEEDQPIKSVIGGNPKCRQTMARSL